jgi:hypothetical protein
MEPDGTACEGTMGCTCHGGACTSMGLGSGATVDQALLTVLTTQPIRMGAIFGQMIPGQTFTAGKTGVLTGIELELTACAPLPMGVSYQLDVFDGMNNFLGTASIPLTNVFGCAPASLDATTIGTGFFDLSAACIPMQAGQKYSFKITTPGAPVGKCSSLGWCTAGMVNASCCVDADCEYVIAVGVYKGTYAGGSAIVSGVTEPFSLMFKTFVH